MLPFRADFDRAVRNESDALFMDVLTLSVSATRVEPFRPETGRRAVLRSTTRKADEVVVAFLVPEREERSLRVTCLELLGTSMIFIRDESLFVLPVMVLTRLFEDALPRTSNVTEEFLADEPRFDVEDAELRG